MNIWSKNSGILIIFFMRMPSLPKGVKFCPNNSQDLQHVFQMQVECAHRDNKTLFIGAVCSFSE